MKFVDLLSIQPDRSGRIPMGRLRSLDLPMPEPVLEQFCSDHGRNGEFQEQYGTLDLLRMTWSFDRKPAHELITATIYPDFAPWVTSVERRVQPSHIFEWQSIDVRPEIVAHWRDNRTWMRAPIFIDNRILGGSAGLRIVEGHTRLGILKALVQQDILSRLSEHDVWIGRY